MPPLYVATSVMLFSSVSYSGRSLARSVFEYCVELYMTLLFFLTTSSESLSFNVEPSDSRYALLLNVVGSSSACSFICFEYTLKSRNCHVWIQFFRYLYGDSMQRETIAWSFLKMLEKKRKKCFIACYGDEAFF